MKLVGLLMNRIFAPLDHQIEELQQIRDSFREMNVEIYGEQLARLLNDW